MENIKYILSVSLIDESNGKSERRDLTALYPFKNIEILIKEIHVCPFCSKLTEGLNCSCKNFQMAFVKLQDLCSDKSHQSELYTPDKNLKLKLPISSLKFRALSKKEILDLGTNFWDPYKSQVDSMSSSHYKVSYIRHDGDKCYFVCKDLISQSVYRFEVPIATHERSNKKIFLRIQATRRSLNVNEGIYGYYVRNHWKYIREFKNWNDLSDTLKVLQEFC